MACERAVLRVSPATAAPSDRPCRSERSSWRCPRRRSSRGWCLPALRCRQVRRAFQIKILLNSFKQFMKRPSLPVCAEQFADVAPRREFVGVQGGLSLNTDMMVVAAVSNCTVGSLVRVVGIFFRGSVVVRPMRLAFVVRARLKRGEKRCNNRIRRPYNASCIFSRCTSSARPLHAAKH